MKKIAILLPLLIAGTAYTTAADALDYSYLTVGYISTDVNELDVSGDGFGINGSFSVSDRFHIFADYSDLDYDFDVTGKQYGVGLGYHLPIAETTDFVATVSYVAAEFSAPGFESVDDDGYGLGLALRSNMNDKVEVFLGVNFVDLSDTGTNTTVTVGAGFNVTKSIQIGATYSYDHDQDVYQLGARFYFGR